MIQISGDRVAVSGPMTMADAAKLLAEGEQAIAAKAVTFDLAAVTEMDSSCLAVVFGWVRSAKAAGQPLQIQNPPQNLLSLAAVYGVADLLPQS